MISLPHCIDLVNACQKSPGVQIAGCQKVDVVEHAIVPIVLNVRQTRPFGLDAHVDVLSHQADKFGWMIKLVFQRYIDDAIVVCLILRSVEVRHRIVLESTGQER